mgnify:CR=1 FL=1
MIKGSVVALVTPFDEFNQVDYKKLKNTEGGNGFFMCFS